LRLGLAWSCLSTLPGICLMVTSTERSRSWGLRVVTYQCPCLVAISTATCLYAKHISSRKDNPRKRDSIRFA
jgi:hypothetical protein